MPSSSLLTVLSERFGDDLCSVLVNAAYTEERNMAEKGLLHHKLVRNGSKTVLLNKNVVKCLATQVRLSSSVIYQAGRSDHL